MITVYLVHYDNGAEWVEDQDCFVAVFNNLVSAMNFRPEHGMHLQILEEAVFSQSGQAIPTGNEWEWDFVQNEWCEIL